jgi:hypothetical protein
MKIARKGRKVVLELTPADAAGLARLLTAASQVDINTSDALGKRAARLYVELAAVAEAHSEEPVLGLTGTLEALDGDGDVVESDGQYAKAWRAAFDAAAGNEISFGEDRPRRSTDGAPGEEPARVEGQPSTGNG